SECDALSIVFNRSLSCLENADHLKAGDAIGHGVCAAAKGIDKRSADSRQWFSLIDVRCVHIAVTVVDQGRSTPPVSTVKCHAFIIDADFLARLEVVVDDHAFRAANQCGPTFNGCQPTHVKVSKQRLPVSNGYVSEVFKLAVMGTSD